MANSRIHSAGKGDSPRPVDYKKWSENWDRIFGKKKMKKSIKVGDIVEWYDPEPDFSGKYEIVRIHEEKVWLYSSTMGKEIEVGLDEIIHLVHK
jgi:transcription antitermination factor NusG